MSSDVSSLIAQYASCTETAAAELSRETYAISRYSACDGSPLGADVCVRTMRIDYRVNGGDWAAGKVFIQGATDGGVQGGSPEPPGPLLEQGATDGGFRGFTWASSSAPPCRIYGVF
jgi:hypothetical protein